MTDVAGNTEETSGRLRRVLTRLPLHALVTFAIRIAAAALTYLVQIVLARYLGDHDYGLFSLSWVWVMFGGYLGCIGMSQTAVQFLPGYIDQKNHGATIGFVRFGIQTTFAASLTLCGVALAGLFAAESMGWISTEYQWPFVFGALCLPFFAFQDLLEGLARARGQMMRAFVPPYILRSMMLILTTFVLLALGWPPIASTAMLAALIGTVLACIVQAVLVLPAYLKLRADGAKSSMRRREWLKATLPLFLADGALNLRQYADVILLGLLVEPAILGIYFATSRLVGLLGLVEYSVAAMSGTKFSVAASRNDDADRQQILNLSVVLVFWPTLLGSIALILIGPYLLSFFGTEFVNGASILGILVIGPVIRALAGSSEEMLNMTGAAADSIKAHLLALFCGVMAILILVPALGMTGAAIAASLSSAANGLALILYAYRKTGIIALPWLGRDMSA
jgi:O-antigen/teichoic acid export membrane protein